MGMYVNPGNRAFRRIAGPDYVDKTGLVKWMNQRIGGAESLVCSSRPRRFGKSYAAKMLVAYYDCSCDSHDLFDDREIGKSPDYEAYLNQFNVVWLDVAGFLSTARRDGIPPREVPGRMVKAIREELVLIEPSIPASYDLEKAMFYCVQGEKGKPFIFVIDEWDAIIREAKGDEEAQERYLDLLRSWFKNAGFTPQVVAGAYLTGILPIKKVGSQSAISDFKEFSILNPGAFAPYVGFTEPEVKTLCMGRGMDFDRMKAWYDGYELQGIASVYNPFSVMNALREGKCRSFWGKTSAAESLTDYIKMDYSGLQETVASLIAGTSVEVDAWQFQNDLEHFRSRDDVLALLIHLGYLTYNEERKTVHIPNEEVKGEFKSFLSHEDIGEYWARLIGRSNKLLEDTLRGNSDAVAATLEEIREESYAPQYYNNEQSLRAVIKYAYLAAIGQYVRVEELPSGKGIADVVFIPVATSRMPAMVVELKWNSSSGGAIRQIKDKKYVSVLMPYKGNILLVGINYSERTGKHTCMIENA